MRKFIVVVFGHETAAYDATRALQELDAEGSITLYGMTVLARDEYGVLTVKKAADQGPLGTAVGALAGGLIGLLGGPVGSVIGIGTGGLVGSIRDLYNMGIGFDFIEAAAEAIVPGRYAVIADIDEEWVTPLDVRMEMLNGTLIREVRAEVEEDLYTRDVNALRAEVEQLKAEYAQAREERRARLYARIEETQARLLAATERANAWLDRMMNETEARMQALHNQAERVRNEARTKIEERMARIHEDHHRRSEKLAQAWDLTKEALRR